MQKRLIWIAAALVLIAIPAVVGLVALRGDDDRRAGALIQAGTGSHELKIDGLVIPGASSGDVIDVASWSWGIKSQVSRTTTTGGATAGRAQASDMQITKTVDNSSPQLFLACANGKHFTRVTLTSRKSGTTQQDYLIVTLEDVIITSVDFAGNSSEEIPMETVTLNFGRATIESKVAVAGKTPVSSRATWDIAAAAKQ